MTTLRLVLLSNMQKLKINPKEIEDIFISHLHGDHVGGLSSFLRLNNQVKLWIPSYFSEAMNAREFIEVKSLPSFIRGSTLQVNLME
ncbi:MAG: hypothetical protein DRQ02_10945 [Candidatus Latescibacterota bacterium]|nr:MAG: hypothetical protein DRQ02_10945 [Candidatus Latescibacterota bacterium]